MITSKTQTAMSRVVLGWCLFWFGLVATVTSCATHDKQSQRPQPGNGIAEYKEIVVESLKSVDAALLALNRVGAQTSVCPPAVVAAFSNEVQRLEVESIRMRARAQAIQNRGDAYFQNWHENMRQVQDPKVRALAEKHRGELEESFARIKVDSQRTRAAFNPFLAGLRRLRSSLENDPANAGLQSTKDLVRSLEENGRSVKEGLAAVGTELNRMTVLITPGK